MKKFFTNVVSLAAIIAFFGTAFNSEAVEVGTNELPTKQSDNKAKLEGKSLIVGTNNSDFFTQVYTSYGKLLEIRSNADITNQTLSYMNLQNQNKNSAPLHNVNFNGAVFWKTELNVSFIDCSFRNAYLRGCRGENCSFQNCDFTGAFISTQDFPTNLGQVTAKEICQSQNYVDHNLAHLTANIDNGDEIFDLTNFDLQSTNLQLKNIEKCKLDNATIKNATLNGISKQQLVSTTDFKRGTLLGVRFVKCNLSEISFAAMNLSGCWFVESNLSRVDFTDAVITNCDFTSADNFTFDLIKATWNYKNNQMKSVKLPLEYWQNGQERSFCAEIYTPKGEKLIITDNANLSGKDLSNIDPIYQNMEEDTDTRLRNVNFTGTNLSSATLNAICENCSFREADMRGFNVGSYFFKNCDFTDAQISQFGKPTFIGRIVSNQIRQTYSYKRRQLAHVEATIDAQNDIHDFSDFDLRYSKLIFTNGKFTPNEGSNSIEYKFDRANIEGAHLTQISKEQLYSTQDYKFGSVNNVTFRYSEFSDANFNLINFTSCRFINSNLDRANFTNTVISDCDFTNAKNLTLDQVKSTWNYKNNHMTGIKLPAEIQKQLDAEKQAVKN
jgi:uncharacterized protein YjbI with pentapeptide repeats